MFENRRWLVIPAEEVQNVNFNQVLQTSPDTLRYSIDGTKTFIKYEVVEYTEDQINTYIDPETGEEHTTVTPAGVYGRPSIYNGIYPEYKHQEMLDLLSTEEWTKNLNME